MKRKAFTLIELLVAVVVIAILMSIVFRLSGIGGNTQKRNETVARLQKLENCLSGYYAAFGSYPPVPMQRNPSRNFRLKVEMGVQDPRGNGEEVNGLNWSSVEAACRAQPVATYFPFRQSYHDLVMNVEKALREKAQQARSNQNLKDQGFDDERLRRGFDDGLSGSGVKGDVLTSEDTVFEFGLMSFLLPRYFFMLGCHPDFMSRPEWLTNNSVPADPQDGSEIPGRESAQWETFRGWYYDNQGKKLDNGSDAWKYSMVPSQAVCARWMPNLEGACRTCVGNSTFFGINISDGVASAFSADNPGVANMIRYPDPSNPNNGYVVNSITILDGWGREFFYYSAPPFQSYTLWSAGPNGRTFCPWVPLDSLDNANEKRTAGEWMADDIMQMGY